VPFAGAVVVTSLGAYVNCTAGATIWSVTGSVLENSSLATTRHQ
jgi:hypothetical protein